MSLADGGFGGAWSLAGFGGPEPGILGGPEAGVLGGPEAGGADGADATVRSESGGAGGGIEGLLPGSVFSTAEAGGAGRAACGRSRAATVRSVIGEGAGSDLGLTGGSGSDGGGPVRAFLRTAALRSARTMSRVRG